MNPESLIKEIRKEYTGEGLEGVTDQIRKVFKKNHEALDLAIEELSTNLYKKEFHFIMELIQNAEDNSYDKNKEPYLKFILTGNYLIIQNNEAGFKEENVRALCAVRKSTKSKVDGYVGEKGIGFKSVFKVSDSPEIHSNGFHFRFHAGKSKKKERLGYILPELLEDISYTIESDFTNIILPFNKRNYKKFSKQLSDIKPNLLLFLKKLKTIHIVNEEEETEIILRKKLLSEDLIELSSENIDSRGDKEEKKYYYKLFSEKVKVPKKYSKDERENVNHTQIIIAFPLGKENGKYYAKTLEDCNVYNFLPIDNFNFRFIIQADFILTSNRESINESKNWNDWMRSVVTKTIKSSLLQLQKGNLKYEYLNYLPRRKEINEDFFKPVVDELHSWIFASKILPIKDGRKLVWIKPGNLFHFNKKIDKIYGSETIRKRTKHQFLHPSASYDEDINDILDVKNWDWEYDKACLEHINWFCMLSDNKREELYSYIHDEWINNNRIINELKDLKILFIEGKTKPVSFNECSSGIFWPLKDKTNYKFLSSLSFINKDYRYSKNVRSVKIKKLFEKVGIKAPNNKKIIIEYIIPEYEKHSDYIDLKKYHLEFFSFIYKSRNLFKKDRKFFKNIKDAIWLMDSYNQELYQINDLFIASNFDSKVNWEKLFKNNSVSFVHEQYFKCDTNSGNITKFLYSLGAKKTADSNDIIKVFKSEDSQSIKRMLIFLNNNWDVYKKIDTILSHILIPVKKELCSPENLFTNTRQNKYLLDSIVNYIPEYINNIAFINALDINNKIIPDNYLIKALRYFRESKPIKIDRKRLIKIYSLFKNSIDVRTAFEKEPLLYSFRDEKWLLPWQVVWNIDIDHFASTFAEFRSQYPKSLMSFFFDTINVNLNIEIDNVTNFLKVFSSFEMVTENERIKIERAISFIFRGFNKRKFDLHDIEDILNSTIYPDQNNYLKDIDDIYFADDYHLFDLLKNKSVSFFNLSKSNIGFKNSIESCADKLGLKLISKSCKPDYTPPKNIRSHLDWSNEIRDLIDLTGYILYHKSQEEYSELNSIFENVEKIKLYLVTNLLINYQIDDLTVTVSERYFIKKNRIYIKKIEKIEDLITDIIINLLKNKPVVKEIVLFLSNADNENQIQNYLKSYNIDLPTDDLKTFAKEKKKNLKKEKIIDVDIDSESDQIDQDDKKVNTKKEKDDYDPRRQKNKTKKNSEDKVIDVNIKEWIPELAPDFKVDIKELKFTKNKNAFNDYYDLDDFVIPKSFHRYKFSSNKSYEKEIGDWGEKFVFHNLKEELLKRYEGEKHSLDCENQTLKIYDENNQEIVSFENRNTKDGITQSGYDFRLIEKNHWFYIEVKSTTRAGVSRFKIEENQWDLCKQYKNDFILIIVRNAGSTDAKIERLPNLFGLYKDELVNLKTGSMTLIM